MERWPHPRHARYAQGALPAISANGYSYGGSFYGSVTVYELLLAQQNVSPSTYTDDVTITLPF